MNPAGYITFCVETLRQWLRDPGASLWLAVSAVAILLGLVVLYDIARDLFRK